MPTYPHGPRLQKGSIVTVGSFGALATIAFQYNPETIKRSLQPQMAGGDEGQRSQAVRYTDAPVETIDVEITIDASDQLERGESRSGIYPQLSLLELLTYPGSQQIIQNTILLETGTLEVAPLAAPLTLFMWGPHRVLPVRLNSLNISEELFDPNLNPLRATVALNMRALSYSDLAPYTQGYNLFLAYQQTKEAMAGQG
jgi:Contractile injection system tube protein